MSWVVVFVDGGDELKVDVGWVVVGRVEVVLVDGINVVVGGIVVVVEGIRVVVVDVCTRVVGLSDVLNISPMVNLIGSALSCVVVDSTNVVLLVTVSSDRFAVIGKICLDSSMICWRNEDIVVVVCSLMVVDKVELEDVVSSSGSMVVVFGRSG
jgi:hypothetical protein